jgi:hypothetical protein
MTLLQSLFEHLHHGRFDASMELANLSMAQPTAKVITDHCCSGRDALAKCSTMLIDSSINQARMFFCWSPNIETIDSLNPW